MSRITVSAATRRLNFRAEEIACCLERLDTDIHAEAQFVGHARAAWSIALKLPKDIVAELVQDAHQDDDPFCTCPDCMADFSDQIV